MREAGTAFGASTRSSLDERERALDLIGRIYDAALDPSRWSHVVRRIVAFVRGDGAIAPDRGVVATGLEPSAVYQGLAKDHAMRQLCIVFGRQSSAAPPAPSAVIRAVDDADLSERERERMRVLMPHLTRALGVMFRLRNAEGKAAASFAVLEGLATGVILLDERGHAIFANRSARRTLDERGAITLRSAQFARGLPRIAANDAATQSRIDAAIRDCLDQHARAVVQFSRAVAVRRIPGRRDLTLQFAPLARPGEYETHASHARMVVFLTDPDESSCVTASTLARLYHLTAAESRLALSLGRGETVASAARRLRITIATARTQLAAVFQKTGTTRQADLVRLLAALSMHRGDST